MNALVFFSMWFSLPLVYIRFRLEESEEIAIINYFLTTIDHHDMGTDAAMLNTCQEISTYIHGVLEKHLDIYFQ